MTGTAVLRFTKWGESSFRTERWPVVAWLISIRQHSADWSEPWATVEPITANGILHAHPMQEDYKYQILCLEMGSTPADRIWRFRNEATFSSLEQAQAYATERLAENRVFAEKQEKRKAAKRRKEKAQRTARRAQRLQQVKEVTASVSA